MHVKSSFLEYNDKKFKIVHSSVKCTIITMKKCLLQLFAVFFVSFCNVESQELLSSGGSLKRKDFAFLLVHSRTLVAGRNETLCLALQEVPLPTKAIIDLKIKDKHNAVTKIMKSELSCFKISIPVHKSSEELVAGIHLQLQLNGSVYSSQNYDKIFIQPEVDVTFIETDRHYYNEGDLVRIRVLVVNHDQKPSLKKNPLNSVKIINPSGFIVNVWDKPSVQLGLAQFEYQLSDQTTLGRWKIECNGIYRNFHVKRYTLPRFKLEIDAPKAVYVKSTKIQFNVCARYSHGHYLKGVVFVKISYSHITHYSTSKLLKLNQGCAFVELATKELNLAPNLENQNDWAMNAVVTVTEHGTNQIETENFLISLKKDPFSLKFHISNLFFQPGMPFKGKLKVTDELLPLGVHWVQICYQISWKDSWNLKPEECSNAKFDENETIDFSVFPFKENVVEVKFTAKSLNYSEVVATPILLTKYFSQGAGALVVESDYSGIMSCRNDYKFKVLYTTNKIKIGNNTTFFYMLKSRNEILLMHKITRQPQKFLMKFKYELENLIGNINKYTKAENYLDWFEFSIKLPERIATKADLVVFCFNRGEVVANSLELQVEKCFSNRVSAAWIDSTVRPGHISSLHISSGSNSLCLLSVTDKASSFLSKNKILNINQITLPFMQVKEVAPRHKINCLWNHKKKSDVSAIIENLEDLPLRQKRSNVVKSADNFDSFEIFNNVGIGAITNHKLIFKPCINDDLDVAPRYYQVNTDDYESQASSSIIRSYFPETWIWDLIHVGESGRAVITKSTPHSITTWDTNILCINGNQGVGVIDKPLNLKTLQPFFLDIIAPRTIKRQETFLLQIVVFNYMNNSLPVKIRVKTNLQIADNPPRSEAILCLKSNDVQTYSLRIKANKLGKENVTVVAETINDVSCVRFLKTKDIKDVVIKEVNVLSEGFPVENTKSILLCGLDEAHNVTWNVDIHEDAIEDSEIARVILNSDLMGPTIQNLERFVKIPTGCGEQVMAMMAPNLFVLKYLSANNKLTNSLRQRILKNLKIGYQRILDYVHSDGSFSAFGYHDNAGSMFLTTFVVRTLQQANEYIFVDEKVIEKATAWILNHQLENGCFSAVSHVFQDMGGTSTENSTAALTSYVIISLLESNINVSDIVRVNSMYCIRGQRNPDKYTLAISTYALFLLGWESEAFRGLQKLVDSANKDGNLMWWSSESASASTNIEISGYVLMSLMKQITNDNLIHASSLVRWLGTQRGSQGGFLSTQDSVVALDAISRYAKVIKGRDPELSIIISNGPDIHNVNISAEDSLRSKEIMLKDVGRRIKLSAVGKGCLLAQLSVTYNVLRPLNNELFDLNVDVQPVSNIDKCSITSIVICMQIRRKLINMMLLEVELPSGYEPDRTSLHQLTKQNDTKVKKFEEFEKRVVLYLTDLDDGQECVSFIINENAVVSNQANATVILYDYYNPERKVLTSYKLLKCSDNDIAITDQHPETDKDVMDAEEIQVVKNGLNEDFVNVDVEMATPTGMEGNVPIFVKPDSKSTVKKTGDYSQ